MCLVGRTSAPYSQAKVSLYHNYWDRRTLLFGIGEGDCGEVWIWQLLLLYRCERRKTEERKGLRQNCMTDTMQRSIDELQWWFHIKRSMRYKLMKERSSVRRNHLVVDKDVIAARYASVMSFVQSTQSEHASRLSISQVTGSKFALIACEMPLSCGEIIW